MAPFGLLCPAAFPATFAQLQRSTALPLNPDPAVPPFPFGWGPSPSRWAPFRNRLAYQVLSRLSGQALLYASLGRIQNRRLDRYGIGGGLPPLPTISQGGLNTVLASLAAGVP